MAFVALAYAYHRANQDDAYQNGVIISATVAGLVLALSLDLGILIGAFGVATWFLLLGLIFSDCFHAVCMRKPWQSRWEERGSLGGEKA